jgi:hypothetical protein
MTLPLGLLKDTFWGSSTLAKNFIAAALSIDHNPSILTEGGLMRTLKESLSFQFLLLASALILGGCQCITVPANDSVPPVATLTVIFNDASGNEVSQFVNTTDHTAPITVAVPAGRSFQTFYAGNDDGGVKTMTLDWKYSVMLGGGVGQLVQPLLAPDDFSNCAQKYRAKTNEHVWSQQTRQYEFKAIIVDFSNNQSTTPAITVQHGQ